MAGKTTSRAKTSSKHKTTKPKTAKPKTAKPKTAKPKAAKTRTSKARSVKTSTARPSSARSAEMKLVEELAGILNATDLNEIEIKKGKLKIRVSKGARQFIQTSLPAPAAGHIAPGPIPAAQAPSPSSSSPISSLGTASDTANAAQDYSDHPGAVKSPMVGTAYTRPSPDADSFVKVGDSVKEGDTVLLVEAMKTFNPITATRSGKVEAIMVDDAQPVEFGEPLFIIA